MRARRFHLPRRTIRMRLTLLYGGFFFASGVALFALMIGAWQHSSTAFVSRAVSRVAASPVPVLPEVARAQARAQAQPQVQARTSQLVVQPGVPPHVVSTIASYQQHSDFHQLIFFSGIALVVMAVFSVAIGWGLAGRVLRPLRTITAAARSISATNLEARLRLGGPDDELKELGDTFDGLLGRLQRAFELQRQFVANASHELRTPLATMRTSLDVAVAKPGTVPPQVLALADGLRQDLDQMDGLLDGLLALARAQHGAATDATTVSLDRLAADALESRAAPISEQRLTVERQGDPGARVTGSATLLARMVENVIDNAVVHNEAGGWVRVRTAATGGRTRIVVENGGPVLDEDEVQELVHPFRRLGTPRTESQRGAGLGLAIVASVVEIHAGTLQIHARAEGGLRVTIDLPAAGART